jgi:tetratricopeptide (TPR) repeat protein
LLTGLDRYLEATKLNEELGNYEEALSSAEKALEIDRYCLGTDHVLYLETLETVQSLKRRRESKI